MKYLLCAIAKNEQHYIQEWIDWHKEIGFDIIIYDNNDAGTPMHDVVGADLIDWRGRTCCQIDAYNDCYQAHKDCDWFIALDIDEFLETTHPLDKWLSSARYATYDGIKINWMNMTDSGLTRVDDGNYSRTRFIEPTARELLHNRQCKTMIRGGLNVRFGKSVHYPDGDIRFCDVLGNERGTGNRTPKAIWEVAHIKHYRCRTVEEFINGKMQRLYPDQSAASARAKITMDLFWKYNRKTDEKIQLAAYYII